MLCYTEVVLCYTEVVLCYTEVVLCYTEVALCYTEVVLCYTEVMLCYIALCSCKNSCVMSVERETTTNSSEKVLVKSLDSALRSNKTALRPVSRKRDHDGQFG